MGVQVYGENDRMIDTTITFIMNLMINGGDVLHQLTDHKYISKLPRVDMVLDDTNKTVVGVTIVNADQESYFRSQIRGYIRSEITAQVMVLTGYGSDDQHCREVVSALIDIFQDASCIGSYRIFINSLKSEIKPGESQGRWIGNLTISITRFDPV